MSIGGRMNVRSVSHACRLAAAIIVLASFPLTAAAASETSKLVVVVYPHESDGAPGMVLVSRGIRTTLASQSAGDISVRNEYVDTSRLHDAEYMRVQTEMLQRKYAGRKVDLVIAVLSSGLDFALAIRGDVFRGVPVVFVLVDRREVEARRLPPDVIGVPIRMGLTGTLDLALRLRPDTRQVFVVAGSSSFDSKWAAEARQNFRGYEDRVEFVYLTGLPMNDLLERVANLPLHSIIYYLHIIKDGAGKDFVPSEALERLASIANAPVFGHVDTFVDRGAVGGHVYRHEVEGRIAAGLALRILSGDRPESIPIPEVSENTYMFNWRELQRWGMSENSLPPGSVVRHKDLSFWDVYRWHTIGVVGLFLIEAMLIAGLLRQRLKLRRAEERFRQVVEAAPTGMLMVGRDGAIVMVNAEVEKLFGYRRDELLGQRVEMLVAKRSLSVHSADRDRFFAMPERHATGPGRDLYGQRKDGSEFPVEIRLGPLQTAQGMFVLESIIDLSERRRAEESLRASQRELRSLSGRLLDAQEDERRRIARELHDDINQELAFVAVEMDRLGQSAPGAESSTAERVQKLSSHVKELSSAVHDLSHQLHPSKLEQLGLVSAVKALCTELKYHHGLEVSFTPHDVPIAIPEAAALCLYRIVQEALRNVIRHSGTKRAVIALSGSPDGIRLRIADEGFGFDATSDRGNGGLGLVSMRERLYLVGGQMVIESRPGGGTRIDVRVPLKGLAEPARTESAAPASEAGLVTSSVDEEQSP
jgi:PAS domain S-box-containing protein